MGSEVLTFDPLKDPSRILAELLLSQCLHPTSSASLGHDVPSTPESETIGQYAQVNPPPPPPPPPLFFSSEEGALCANLWLFPRKIHSCTLLSCLSHYGGESYLPPSAPRNWQTASPPKQTARTRARLTGRGTACVVYTEFLYLHMSIIRIGLLIYR